MQFVLGSRSPRRRELLDSFVGAERLLVWPPTNSAEEGFDGLHDDASIRERLNRVVRAKMGNVVTQVQSEFAASAKTVCSIAADTVVVAEDPQFGLVVLGQPSEPSWQDDVRDWMLRLYSDTTHEVWTGFQVVCGDQTHEEIVVSKVRFCELTPAIVERYVATGESVGKAGGYAVQGAAAAFVEAIDGSLTNIIGLPVIEVMQAMESMAVDVWSPKETV
jgi:septum formation protein